MDRNNPLETLVILPKESLSARRAWIEITDPINLSDIPPSRSPQGERG